MAPWLNDLARAAKRNRRALAKGEGEMARIFLDAGGVLEHIQARSLAAAIERAIPYRFEGAAHRIVDAEACVRRGYGACGDGAAIALAVLSFTEWRVSLCYETVPGHPDYAHTRVIVDGVPVEPWPSARDPRATGCTFTVDGLALLHAARR